MGFGVSFDFGNFLQFRRLTKGMLQIIYTLIVKNIPCLCQVEFFLRCSRTSTPTLQALSHRNSTMMTEDVSCYWIGRTAPLLTEYVVRFYDLNFLFCLRKRCDNYERHPHPTSSSTLNDNEVLYHTIVWWGRNDRKVVTLDL